MGSGSWNPSDWQTHQTRSATQTQSQIFSSSGIDPDMDPSKIKFRESVDSADNPLSTPIIMTCDVTGSMGQTAEQIVRNALGVVVEGILDRKPVTDPHICIMATGDHLSDHAPLQVTQFEADNRIVDQLKKIWIEGNGGGNGGESYMLPWYFAAYKVKADCISKRGKKGFIFTIGDENMHMKLDRSSIKRIFGDGVEHDIDTKDLFELVSQNWHVYHLVLTELRNTSIDRWRDFMGEHVLPLSDLSALGEVIISTMEVVAGKDPDQVASTWSGSKAIVVRNAIKGLTKSQADQQVVRI